ncbi:MAG: heterodisulfide reductase [Latescibacteria bacterium DG_63]|uniref:Heterodisulfide reductase n=2 Tax=Bacteria division TA06 TaxID=1156500 RepID=A0A0S8JHT5_UNCT6|nr:MAG: heterodisulfide reductase [Latescibacteria bacterium DG_63]KPK67663.1 MAG: heterodisulfide reductase [candidate division TA06 bacterium SM23_40]KPL09366.1 MAG: heterodisulfide reductase [candidate division TA06 bacterium SM1_40]
MTELDPTFKFDVTREPGGEQLMRCFACGTCTASCPVREIDEKFNPRRIIRMVLLGMREEVLSSQFIWLCSTCYACQERCPQDVRITELMSAIKNLAVKEGHLPAAYKMQLELIRNMGRLYEIDEFDNKKRSKAGLPELESTNEDVKKIFVMTGADRLIGGEEGGGE